MPNTLYELVKLWEQIYLHWTNENNSKGLIQWRLIWVTKGEL